MVHFSVSVFRQRCKTLWRKVQKLWKRSWNEWLRKTKCEDMMNRKEHWRPQVHQKHTKENKLPKCICANCQNVVVQIAKMYLRKLPKYICANCKMFLSKILNVFVHRALAATGPSEAHWGNQIDKMYLWKLFNVFVQIIKCVCPKYQNIFVHITKYICA